MRFPTLFACAAALLLISAGASHAAAPAITGEMQKKYESMQSFTAEFTQRLVHQESGSEETRQGTLAFQKPLRVRWETKAPHAELLVITDKDVWDYLPDEELAYQYSPEVVHDSRSIIQVITGQSRLDKDFTVEAEPDDNGLAVLRLYPKDPSPQLVEALLWVDKGTKLIKKAQILDFYGNTNEVALTSLTPDASIKAGTFQFTPPQGITVENLMNQDVPNARCCNNALALPRCPMSIGSRTHEEFMEEARAFHGYPAPGLIIGGYMVELAKRHMPGRRPVRRRQ